MSNVVKGKRTKRVTNWLLLVVVVLYIITGFGMTQFRIVEPLTLGLLNRLLAFQVHTYLWAPFLVLLALHIYQRTARGKVKRNTAKLENSYIKEVENGDF